MKNKLPYDSSDKHLFWRTAVASKDPSTNYFDNLTPRFKILKKHKISSAGSCFAQHIGNWLTKNNYTYLRSKLNTDETSSFAFGNIYTPHSLLQWFTKSKEYLAEYSIYLDQENGRYVDLLLPSTYQSGFTNREDLLNNRDLILEETCLQLIKSDYFIFTLGLIETWVDNNDVCYPTCPGLKKGLYDPTKYKLKVFDYKEIYSDLDKLFQHIKTINPKINFVITVSPVPLTATATNNHVMVANSYSKSILRAVAGAFSDSRNDVNYFPSYELITTTLSNDFRFLENRRTVSEDGVNYVMGHWSNTLGNEKENQKVADYLETKCDEEMLDAINQNFLKTDTNHFKTLTLIGDSHFGKLAKAFNHIGQDYCGGMVMNGSGFAQNKFMLSKDRDIMIPMESADSRALWQKIVINLDDICNTGNQENSCILTNIGMQTHQTVAMFVDWMKTEKPEKLHKIGIQDYVDFFERKLSDQMTLIFLLKSQGHRVIVISDTPFWQHFEESKDMAPLVMAYMDAFEYVCQEIGIEFFHAARAFNDEIANPLDYSSELVYSDGSNDYFHGGDAYYIWLAEKIKIKFSL